MLSDTRVSDKLYFHGKKVMDAIEEIFIGYIFFHIGRGKTKGEKGLRMKKIEKKGGIFWEKG